ncbi:hypothetical protein DFH06DRAFT_1121512 [Mycena polygramma]|nr:hypothetical protein DFH06DRAFT_1121512 [Mycena polygramma]
MRFQLQALVLLFAAVATAAVSAQADDLARKRDHTPNMRRAETRAARKEARVVNRDAPDWKQVVAPPAPHVDARVAPSPNDAPEWKRAAPSPDDAPGWKRVAPSPNGVHGAPEWKRASPSPDDAPGWKRDTDDAPGWKRDTDDAPGWKRVAPSPNGVHGAPEWKRAAPSPNDAPEW